MNRSFLTLFLLAAVACTPELDAETLVARDGVEQHLRELAFAGDIECEYVAATNETCCTENGKFVGCYQH